MFISDMVNIVVPSTFHFKCFMISVAIALAIRGGTAFPTWVNCGVSSFLRSPPVVRFPWKTKESSKL